MSAWRPSSGPRSKIPGQRSRSSRACRLGFGPLHVRYRLRMRSLVTGAAGFIGSHLTEELRSRGDDVVAVDSFTDYYDPARKRENARDLDVIDLDLEAGDLDLLVGSVDRIFHLAGQPGVRASF